MLKLTQITIECLFDHPQLGEVVSDAVWGAFLKEQEDNIRNHLCFILYFDLKFF